MKPRLDAIGLVVSDLTDSISFYRRLGIDLPDPAENGHAEATLEGGIRFMIDTIAEVRSFDPNWTKPSRGHRIALAFICDSPAEVDAQYKSLIDHGAEAYKEPWDAFWGQRDAEVRDPDGNIVGSLCAALLESVNRLLPASKRKEVSMKVNTFLINLTSEDPERMKAFYGQTIGLEKNPDMGDDAFHAGGAVIAIDGHSETKGSAKEPQRVLIDFFVEDLKSEQSRLESKGVKFIRKAGKEWWGGIICTFRDPDGNYCQLIEYKPEA